MVLVEPVAHAVGRQPVLEQDAREVEQVADRVLVLHASEAADARSPRNGRFIEIIGTYEPRRDPSVINIDNDRATHWLNSGAQPTEPVRR